MDTISRETTSPLPIAGVILGAVAIVIGAYAAVSLSKVNRALADQKAQLGRIDDLSGQVQTAQATADKAKSDVAGLAGQTQTAVTQIATELAGINEKINHLTEVRAAPKAAKGGPKGEPPVAGPGEYIVKSGDSGAKIARANGCTLSDLEAVNPGVAWTHLKIGEKLKLPEKK